jgi:hypothetical protein
VRFLSCTTLSCTTPGFGTSCLDIALLSAQTGHRPGYPSMLIICRGEFGNIPNAGTCSVWMDAPSVRQLLAIPRSLNVWEVGKQFTHHSINHPFDYIIRQTECKCFSSCRCKSTAFSSNRMIATSFFNSLVWSVTAGMPLLVKRLFIDLILNTYPPQVPSTMQVGRQKDASCSNADKMLKQESRHEKVTLHISLCTFI